MQLHLILSLSTRPGPKRGATRSVAVGLQNREASKKNYRVIVLVK
jgi:hypothetical protein